MLSKKELMILSCLRQNARQTLTNLSKKTHIPISTIYEKLKLYQNNFIKKNACLIDFSKLGFNTLTQILVRVDKKDREAIKKYLSNNPSVNSILKVSNGFDFMIEGVFRNIKDLEEFNEELDERFKIKKKDYYFVIEEVKREAFMSGLNSLELLNL